MATSGSKRNFFEKPTISSVIVSLIILGLMAGFGVYREQRIAAKMEARQRDLAQKNEQAYLDGVEFEATKLLRQGASESEVIDDTVNTFRQKGATESEIDALKKRLSAVVVDKK
jgi:hypothetical protein